MWLQMGEDDGVPLVYFHQVKHMWVGYANGRSRAVDEDAEAGERQAKAQLLTALKVDPKQAVLHLLSSSYCDGTNSHPQSASALQTPTHSLLAEPCSCPGCALQSHACGYQREPDGRLWGLQPPSECVPC